MGGIVFNFSEMCFASGGLEFDDRHDVASRYRFASWRSNGDAIAT